MTLSASIGQKRVNFGDKPAHVRNAMQIEYFLAFLLAKALILMEQNIWLEHPKKKRNMLNQYILPGMSIPHYTLNQFGPMFWDRDSRHKRPLVTAKMLGSWFL